MLASEAISPTLLAGSLVVLWGTLIVAISMSESFRQSGWSGPVGVVGTLIICIGTAVAFVGSTAGALTRTDAALLEWGLLLMALTAVVGLLAPRVAKHPCTKRLWKKFRGKREGNKWQGQGINGQEDEQAGVASVGAEGLKRPRQDVAEKEDGDDLSAETVQAPQEPPGA